MLILQSSVFEDVADYPKKTFTCACYYSVEAYVMQVVTVTDRVACCATFNL